MKKILAIVLALAMVLSALACAKKAEPAAADVAKGEGVMTYEEYAAASEDYADVVIEAYVQLLAYNQQYSNANLYLADKDGGYFVYRMPCTDDDAAKLLPGTKVKISGQKGAYANEPEIAEGSATYEIEEGSYIAEAKDITSILGNDDELYKLVNQLVAIKGAKVVASTVEGVDSDFWYGWENTAKKGDNADLYFNIEVNGQVFNMCVESDEWKEGSDVYTAVESLKIGDTVDLEGFLYWYYGANPHISAVKAA